MTSEPQARVAQRLFPLEPQYRERVWGGQRLLPHTPPIGEAWIAHPDSVVSAGAARGRTLAELLSGGLTGLDAEALLGRAVAAQRRGFPLLIKLLDCADWLSVQVHPDDQQARRMVGPGELGKTEAWHFLEAEPGAQILMGVTPGTAQAGLEAAIRGGTVLDVARRWDIRAGDSAFIPAGTLHALGPGLLLYEVQEASDTTYRVYDWDRPASAGRALHLEESVAVTRADMTGELHHADESAAGVGSVQGVLISCDYFVLESRRLDQQGESSDTLGLSFHIVTVMEGRAELSCGGEQITLERHQTAVVAGGAGAYQLRALDGAARILRASVPPEASLSAAQ